MSEPNPAQTAAEYREAQIREYSTYKAAVPIDINGVRAFNVGDPVPVSHVEQGVLSQAEVEPVGDEGAVEQQQPPQVIAEPPAEPQPSRARSARAAAEESATKQAPEQQPSS